ncbi:MAG: peptide deformylase [Candidatus Paceibacterota bacterium]|jgi:peptide deformylase
MAENSYAIYTIQNKSEKKVLLKKTKEFVFKSNGSAEVGGKTLSKKEIDDLIREMRRIMRQANGVGLSANQIGLNYRLFVAEVPNAEGEFKFYAIFNPKLEKTSNRKTALLEEGCLSVPKTFGKIKRNIEIKLTGLNKYGKPVKIKAWGLLAHVFQHETNHLDGKLFTDAAEELYELPPPKLETE